MASNSCHLIPHIGPLCVQEDPTSLNITTSSLISSVVFRVGDMNCLFTEVL
jgi:hypothetical protein